MGCVTGSLVYFCCFPLPAFSTADYLVLQQKYSVSYKNVFIVMINHTFLGQRSMNKMLQGVLSLTTVCATLTFSPSVALAHGCIENRAGIDMGSGSTKIQVTQVNVCEHSLGKVLFEDQRPVGFNADLAKSGNNQLSDDIQQQGIKALSDMVAKANSFKPTRITGVATAVFRSASNGQQVIDRFNQQAHVNLKIISQQQEAELGFQSAKAALHEKNVKDEDLLVWNIGGGSMQMTAYRQKNGVKTVDVYQGKLASVTLKDFITSVLQNKDVQTDSTPNPIGSLRNTVLRYVNFYARTHVSPEIKQAAHTKRVIGIGGVHGYSIKDNVHLRDNTYRLTDLEQASKNNVWKGDSELKGEYRATDVSNLLLVEGYMQALDIPQVTVVKASLIQGILLQ